MIKNASVKKRLFECNLTEKEIIKEIKKFLTNKSTVFLYCSQIENLGTKSSDFDIYIVGENKIFLDILNTKQEGKCSSLLVSIKETSLDIEFWSFANFEALLNKVSGPDCNNTLLEELKVLHRFEISEIIFNEPLANKIKSEINHDLICDIVKSFFSNFATSALDDALVLYNSQEYIPALLTAKDALQNAVSALNTSKGFINVKPKWISKIFINNNGYEKEIFDKYMNLMVYSTIEPSNVDKYVEEIIRFTQDILSLTLF